MLFYILFLTPFCGVRVVRETIHRPPLFRPTFFFCSEKLHSGRNRNERAFSSWVSVLYYKREKE